MDKDVYHYLDKIANNDSEGQSRGLSHRIVRSIVSIYGVKNKSAYRESREDSGELNDYYDGQKNSIEVQS